MLHACIVEFLGLLCPGADKGNWASHSTLKMILAANYADEHS